MKVLLLSHSSGTGGATRSLQAMATDLQSAGCEVSILAPAGNMRTEWEASKFRVIDWKPPHCPWFIRPIYSSGLVKFNPFFIVLLVLLPVRLWNALNILKSIFREKDYDVVHINSLTLFPLAWILPKALKVQKSRPKVIWHLREMLNPSLFLIIKKLIVNIISECANNIVAITENEAFAFTEKNSVSIIHNTVPSTWDVGKVVAISDKSNVVMASALSPAKGLQQYLEMAERLESIYPKIRFDLFTPSYPYPFYFKFNNAPMMEAYMNTSLKRAKLIQLGENRFWKLSHTISQELYSEYGIYVRPDLAACPWGRDIIEAMWMGMAVVATGNFSGFVVDGETGFLVPSGDVDALVEKVALLIDDKDLRARMRVASRERALILFSPTVHAQKICNVFGVDNS